MLTEKDYCDYDTCVALEELGITYFGLHFYKIGYPETLHHNYMQYLTERTAGALGRVLAIPLYSAQKWLREEKNLHIEVRWYSNLCYEYEVKEAEGKIFAEGTAFMTYEEALSTAVYMATKYLKER